MMSSMIVYLIFVPILAAVLLLANIFLGPHNPYSSKSSAFECGFHSFLDQNRQQFSVSFFIFALLFLLFDLEILLVYPYTVSAYNNESYGLWVVLIFLAVLTVGFVFEIGKGALKINSRQTVNLHSSKINALSNLNASEPKSRSSLSRSANHVSSSLSRQHVSSSKRHYSTYANSVDTKVLLDPNFFTGFADGESCFYITVTRDSRQKTGWRVQAIFLISLHEKDRPLLELIQGFFGVGKIYKQGKESIQYRVISIKDLKVIIDHFDKFPLITKKRADFELFKQIVDLMDRKQHLTSDGLQKIVNIRASLNNGLSDELKASFPNVIPVPRPIVEFKGIQDPNWVAGFASGEGSFIVIFGKSTSHKSGVQVRLRFTITQHSRDAELIKSLVEYFGCGEVYKNSAEGEVVVFVVTRFSDISDKIIPLFEKYRIEGVKAMDFSDFCKAADIVKAKAHLTQEGLEEIRQIKAGMNTGRSWSS